MSSSDTRIGSRNADAPKYTSGEKCIISHLIATFSVTIILIILYFVHLCLVNHKGWDAFKVSLRSGSDKENLVSYIAGLAYLNGTPPIAMCGTLLLSRSWSLAPGHCVDARADSQLADLLPAWKIEYLTEDGLFVSDIKTSVPHPQFRRTDFSNNIGLFQHNKLDASTKYVFPDGLLQHDDNNFNLYENENMTMIGWKLSNSENHWNLMNYSVKIASFEKCVTFMSTVVDLRSYEFCGLFKDNHIAHVIDHGFILVLNSKVMGFSSWGEKGGQGLPFIVISIVHYKEWIGNVINMNIDKLI